MSIESTEFKLGVTTEQTRNIDLKAAGEWLFLSFKSLHPEVTNEDLEKVIATIPEDTLLSFAQLYMGVIAAVHQKMINN